MSTFRVLELLRKLPRLWVQAVDRLQFSSMFAKAKVEIQWVAFGRILEGGCGL